MLLKNVIVVGGTGNAGTHIVKALLDGGFNVTVLSQSTSTSTVPDGIKVIKSDYSESSLAEAFKDQDAVVATLGRLAIGVQSKLIDAAEKAGVKRFIPSEFGADTTHPKAQEVVPLFKVKADIVSQLKQKAASNPNFTWTGIAAGGLLDLGISVGLFGAVDIKSNTATIWNEGRGPTSVSTLAQLGRSVAATLTHPEETANKFIYVHSFVVTSKTIVDAIEKQVGKPFTISHMTSAQGIEEGKALMAQGNPAGAGKILVAVILGEEYGSNFEGNPNLMNKTLGLPEEDFDKVIREVVEGQQP